LERRDAKKEKGFLGKRGLSSRKKKHKQRAQSKRAGSTHKGKGSSETVLSPREREEKTWTGGKNLQRGNKKKKTCATRGTRKKTSNPKGGTKIYWGGEKFSTEGTLLCNSERPKL